MKRILLTGGGTAGHVTPHIALLPKLQTLGVEVHYIGRYSGIERDLIEPLGIPYHPIAAGKLRRYLDWQNVTDIVRIFEGLWAALRLIRSLRPTVIFSKGGFVACPVVWAAWLNRIPVIIHESDLTPGLANKLSAPFATNICYSFPETAAHLSKRKAIHTGIPIRESLLTGSPAEGRRICGFTGDKPTILIIGGSQGATAINAAIRSALPEVGKTYHIVHICGPGGIERSRAATPGYAQFEYVTDDLPHLFALADLVISRAGATTLFEILALRKPNLLIPLPLKASRGDQILNAQSFEKLGFSAVLSEENLTPETLLVGINQIYQHRERFCTTMQTAAPIHGVKRVMAVLAQYLGESGSKREPVRNVK
jgi:UDP-N-acetylglucosamine--N-acetylmuramyl-(pentapeptide) pyrophosphoryl-undecaprenol N-acetylglucosamine transferase